MMRSTRFSIAGLMAMVLIVALGFAALRNASITVLSVSLLVSRGVIGIAIVGAVCCSGADRAYWLGLAIAGCIYTWCRTRAILGFAAGSHANSSSCSGPRHGRSR